MNILTQILQYTATSLIPQQQPKHNINKHKLTTQYSITTPQPQNNKHHPNNQLQLIQIELPPNYAQLIMQLQMQIQSSYECNMETVCKLNQLYMIGIEYYTRMGANERWKVQHFSKKLIGLFNNVEVNRIITRNRDRDRYQGGDDSKRMENQRNCNQGNINNNSQNKQYVKLQHNNNNNKINTNKTQVTPTNPILYTANLKQQLSKFTSQSDNVIKNIIQINSKKQQRSNRLITNDLQNQQNTLKKRLEERIRSRSKRSLKIQRQRQVQKQIQRLDRSQKIITNDKSREKSNNYNLNKQNININRNQ